MLRARWAYRFLHGHRRSAFVLSTVGVAVIASATAAAGPAGRRHTGLVYLAAGLLAYAAVATPLLPRLMKVAAPDVIAQRYGMALTSAVFGSFAVTAGGPRWLGWAAAAESVALLALALRPRPT